MTSRARRQSLIDKLTARNGPLEQLADVTEVGGDVIFQLRPSDLPCSRDQWVATEAVDHRRDDVHRGRHDELA